MFSRGTELEEEDVGVVVRARQAVDRLVVLVWCLSDWVGLSGGGPRPSGAACMYVFMYERASNWTLVVPTVNVRDVYLWFVWEDRVGVCVYSLLGRKETLLLLLLLGVCFMHARSSTKGHDAREDDDGALVRGVHHDVRRQLVLLAPDAHGPHEPPLPVELGLSRFGVGGGE